jgi:hypothetical protein
MIKKIRWMRPKAEQVRDYRRAINVSPDAQLSEETQRRLLRIAIRAASL